MKLKTQKALNLNYEGQTTRKDSPEAKIVFLTNQIKTYTQHLGESSIQFTCIGFKIKTCFNVDMLCTKSELEANMCDIIDAC